MSDFEDESDSAGTEIKAPFSFTLTSVSGPWTERDSMVQSKYWY